MALISLSSRPIGGGGAACPPDTCFFSPIRGADNCNGGGPSPSPRNSNTVCACKEDAFRTISDCWSEVELLRLSSENNKNGLKSTKLIRNFLLYIKSMFAIMTHLPSYNFGQIRENDSRVKREATRQNTCLTPCSRRAWPQRAPAPTSRPICVFYYRLHDPLYCSYNFDYDNTFCDRWAKSAEIQFLSPCNFWEVLSLAYKLHCTLIRCLYCNTKPITTC